jgi:hypothetical protein
MLIRLFALLWLCLCSLAASAAADPLPVPTVDYTAEQVIESESGIFTGRVYVAAGRERAEIGTGGARSIIILRPDRRLGWRLTPAERMYQETDIAKARGRLGAGLPADASISREGGEIVEGFETTKHELRMKDGSAGGFVWLTREDIAVKTVLLRREGGKMTRTTIILRNLEIAPQDASLFELPDGYEKMPSMGLFGGFSMGSRGVLTLAASGRR